MFGSDDEYEDDGLRNDSEWQDNIGRASMSPMSGSLPGVDLGPIRRSKRLRARNSKLDEPEETYSLDYLKTPPSSRKRSKKRKDGLSRKKRKRGKRDESSSDEVELIIDDPNSYYDTDEYDSDGRLIKRDEIKKKQFEEERMQRKIKRKPNIPHLIKYYTPVPTDESGKPILPIHLKGGLTILNLGGVVTDRPKFHAKRYIWPVGFKSTRVYSSMTQMDKKCVYTSEILDRGEEPGFVVTCWEDENNPIVIEKPTASGAWAEVAKRYFDMRKEVTGKEVLTQLSGPEMFGYAHPSISKLIQEMPGAELCKVYQVQQFVPISAKQKEEGQKKRRGSKNKQSDSESDSDQDSDEEEEEEVKVSKPDVKDEPIRPSQIIMRTKSAEAKSSPPVKIAPPVQSIQSPRKLEPIKLTLQLDSPKVDKEKKDLERITSNITLKISKPTPPPSPKPQIVTSNTDRETKPPNVIISNLGNITNKPSSQPSSPRNQKNPTLISEFPITVEDAPPPRPSIISEVIQNVTMLPQIPPSQTAAVIPSHINLDDGFEEEEVVEESGAL